MLALRYAIEWGVMSDLKFSVFIPIVKCLNETIYEFLSVLITHN